MRHTFASRLAMAGVTEGTIASLLQHSDTALVRRYAHLSPSYLQEAVEKVSRFGKAETEPTKPERKQEPADAVVLRAVSTGPGTGKSNEGIEGE